MGLGEMGLGEMGGHRSGSPLSELTDLDPAICNRENDMMGDAAVTEF